MFMSVIIPNEHKEIENIYYVKFNFSIKNLLRKKQVSTLKGTVHELILG